MGDWGTGDVQPTDLRLLLIAVLFRAETSLSGGLCGFFHLKILFRKKDITGAGVLLCGWRWGQGPLLLWSLKCGDAGECMDVYGMPYQIPGH